MSYYGGPRLANIDVGTNSGDSTDVLESIIAEQMLRERGDQQGESELHMSSGQAL